MINTSPDFAIDAQTRKEIALYVQSLIDDLPEGPPQIQVSECAENYRSLPIGSPFPGQWKNERTPLFVEIMDNLSVNSPIQEVIIQKSAQIGATAAVVENFIGYILRVVPGPVLYVSANEKLLKSWTDTRLLPLLVSTGMDKKIGAQVKLKKNNRSGSTTQFKEFPGGFLGLGTGNSDASLRSFTYRNIILDEVSAYPISIKGQGDPVGLARARTKNFGRRKKILLLSTPGDVGICKISSHFDAGDQRYAFMPCPYCNEKIVLEFSKEFAPYHDKAGLGEKEFGLVWEMDGRQLKHETVKYKCVHCQNLITESQKWPMIQQAEWIATAESSNKYLRSYHIDSMTSLLAPWSDAVQSYLNCGESEAKRKVFVNTDLGLPYRMQAMRPKFNKLADLKGNYSRREVPSKVLFLTASVDVQKGSRTNPDYPPRLEMEICGHGLAYRTFSIDYVKFVGSIDNAYSGAWEQFYEYIENQFSYLRSDGFVFEPVMCAIDARFYESQDTVFSFCNRLDNFFPIMGFADLKKTDEASGILDEAKYRDVDPFREKTTGDRTIIQVSTNWYKRLVYRNLCVEREPGLMQKHGFCEFPREYDEKYFQGLIAEEPLIDGTFVLPSGKHNEPLDLRVYNLCMADVWLTRMVLILRRQYEQQGLHPSEAAHMVNKKTVLLQLEQKTGIRLQK